MKKYDFALEIKHTNRRKTLALQVKEQLVIILAPRNVQEFDIEHILDTNMNWIINRLNKNLTATKNKKFYRDGEQWEFFHQTQRLKIQTGCKSAMALRQEEGLILLQLSEQDAKSKNSGKIIRTIFIDFIDNMLLEILAELARKYAQRLHLEFNNLAIKDYKSMWGMCKHKDLTFNRRLIFTPKWILEYVVVHEVCHLKYPHHQKDFWQAVAGLYPQYKAAKHWLKINGTNIISIDF